MPPAAPPAPSAKALRFAPKPKPAGARTVSPEARLAYLRKRLGSQLEDGHLAKALKTVDQLIALTPSAGLTATKISILLHLDRYAAALALLASLSPTEQAALAFERAYGLYRLGREAEARTLLEEAGGAGEGGEFLRAQLAYRAHDYDTATELYSSLLTAYPADHPAHADIAQDHALAASRAAFYRTGYLDALASSSAAAELDADALEDEVPVPLAAGAAAGENAVAGPSRAAVKPVEKARKRRNPLPKGTVESAQFAEDPDRWLPLATRASNPKSSNYNPNYTSGTSMSNIASSGPAPASQAGGKKKSGGGAKKKGKK